MTQREDMTGRGKDINSDDNIEEDEVDCSRKRIPCLCTKCCGKLVSRQTVHRHLGLDEGFTDEPTRPEPSSCHWSDKSLSPAHSYDLSCVSGAPSVDEFDDEITGYESVGDIDSGSEGVDAASNISIQESELAEADNSDVDEDGVSDHDIDMNENERGGLNNASNDDIEKFIMRTLKAKVKFGWSREETLQQLNNFYEYAQNDRIPHGDWQGVMKFLKGIGYDDPRVYKICCANDHVDLLEQEAEGCPTCGKERKKCIDYYVLGINLKEMFSGDDYVKDILDHWENRESWFNLNENVFPKKEIWHGDRFKELSHFWDFKVKTALPGKCPNCNDIISVTELEEFQRAAGITSGDRDSFNVECFECGNSFMFSWKYMHGSPLNQAFIFHEDGFNSFNKKTRGIATIQLTSACTLKEKRSRGVSFQVYSFIPTCYLSDGIVHKLDAFFKPLFDEIEALYLSGVSVSLPRSLTLESCSIPAGEHRVRALLLLGTADLKAHQDIALYAGGGRCGCRKCLLVGVYIAEKRHYYYGNFRERYSHPAAPRTVEYIIQHGKRCEKAKTKAGRLEIQRETGVKGLTILLKLHRLYGFDPIDDMVIDRMHVCFNMLKREFVDKIWPDMGPNVDKEVNERDPSVGGLVHRGEFANALDAVQWTADQKASGAARLKSFTDQLGGWKTAEFNKFSQVAREVLAYKIPSKAFDSFMLLCQANNMLYSKNLRNSGWTVENLSTLNDLLWSHAIRFEEYYGLGSCTENLEYSTHIVNDIHRHSSPDNYTCELYERGIRVHKQQKHNSKSIEKTLTLREGLRQFITLYERRYGPISQLEEKKMYKFDPSSLQDENNSICLHESSLDAAKAILCDFKGTGDTRMKQAIAGGVAIGKMSRGTLQDQEKNEIKEHLVAMYQHEVNDVPSSTNSFKTVVKYNEYGEIERFKAGDTCVVAGGENLQEEWIVKLSSFTMVGPLDGCYYNFADGEYYIPAVDSNRRNFLVHEWTKTHQLVPRHYNRGRLQPVENLRRKCILYPDPLNVQEPSYYLPIDYQKPESYVSVRVPVFPELGDDLLIQGTSNERWYGRVIERDTDVRTVTVQWFFPSRVKDIWKIGQDTDDVHFNSIISKVEFQRAERYGRGKYELIQ